ncbi:hypothetical protein Ccrd_010376 [Cynara cardunculus var. scolymus]|uniref:Uncharacterized protein n=1 Tax=Cynara cardunculus var. scolymus TaxID=59895 RepID=A0A103YLC8_CYNCS|nr:hypothetical protein Ccrd_010376 [Cynara cardunculus var. scolymus]
MGLCSSKTKIEATNPNGHKPRSTSDEPNILYTKSLVPAVQIPVRKQPPPSTKRVYKSDTILGKPFEDVKQHYTMGERIG